MKFLQYCSKQAELGKLPARLRDSLSESQRVALPGPKERKRRARQQDVNRRSAHETIRSLTADLAAETRMREAAEAAEQRAQDRISELENVISELRQQLAARQSSSSSSDSDSS